MGKDEWRQLLLKLPDTEFHKMVKSSKLSVGLSNNKNSIKINKLMKQKVVNSIVSNTKHLDKLKKYLKDSEFTYTNGLDISNRTVEEIKEFIKKNLIAENFAALILAAHDREELLDVFQSEVKEPIIESQDLNKDSNLIEELRGLIRELEKKLKSLEEDRTTILNKYLNKKRELEHKNSKWDNEKKLLQEKLIKINEQIVSKDLSIENLRLDKELSDKRYQNIIKDEQLKVSILEEKINLAKPSYAIIGDPTNSSIKSNQHYTVTIYDDSNFEELVTELESQNFTKILVVRYRARSKTTRLMGRQNFNSPLKIVNDFIELKKELRGLNSSVLS
ncbi:hypothetical protein MKY91_17400 [Alkalicoccobacillus gibsonii]|uniref:Uncharacterized protein n=1 Tax=Alkalicoccobacillus gibsonii TaxID=79881 RepID=A0ABU9VLZ2_9BACI